MATGKEIETRGHTVGFREEIAKAAASSDDDFFTWFDSARDAEAAFVRGGWDFIVHIALPASRFLSAPEDKVALEIGHGGGRIIAAASRCFKAVIGIDIHDNNEKVEHELKRRGVNNCRLLKTEGTGIPVEPESVDLVYSFIVLQHIEKMEVFEQYLRETYRVLKPDGIAVLYFGRKYVLSMNRASRFLYYIDRLAERFLLPGGFQELPARVNCTNLIVSLPHAKSLARRAGFEVLAGLVSKKGVPDGIERYGGQNGLVIRRRG